jgi:NTP pyrophosphatase (non-canonical NTP hydrolase)
MEIKQFQKTVDQWISNTDVGYFDILTNTTILMEEVGELARVVSRQYGMQRAKESENLNLADELADILWVVAAIANDKNIDLTSAIEKNIVKKTKRDINRFNKEY